MIIDNVLRNKFHDELIRNGITPILVEALDGDNPIGVKITFNDGTDMDLVQQIINVHDTTPLPPRPTETEIQQEIINTLGQELAQLKLQFMMGGM